MMTTLILLDVVKCAISALLICYFSHLTDSSPKNCYVCVGFVLLELSL